MIWKVIRLCLRTEKYWYKRQTPTRVNFVENGCIYLTTAHTAYITCRKVAVLNHSLRPWSNYLPFRSFSANYIPVTEVGLPGLPEEGFTVATAPSNI